MRNGRLGSVVTAVAYGILAAAAAIASAQELVTIEQAGSRSGPEFTAVYEGRAVRARGQVASAPVWALGTYYLPLRDAADHGLVLRGERNDFSSVAPGDWVEVSGTIQSRAGLPLLAPSSMKILRHDAPPEPKDLSLAEIAGFRYLGVVARTTATIASAGENLGGKSFVVTDHGSSLSVFLPRSSGAAAGDLRLIHAGDRVRLTGLVTQYSLEAPHNGGFQLMLASAADVQRIGALESMTLPLIFFGGSSVTALLAVLWWLRERRQGAARQSMRAFYALSEEIISAASPVEIAAKLIAVLPAVTQATAVRLYLYNRRRKALERVPTSIDPEPMAVPVDAPPEGLVSGAVSCFLNRTLLNVPDVRRSPFLTIGGRAHLPRSAMFVPLLSKDDILGVLEMDNARRLGYFSAEEQGAAQHLANQVAASLKLQEQQTMREQLFRSEKLAATGQLISGIASDLRAPLEGILKMAAALAESPGRPVEESDLRFLAAESRRASEIVDRLVSFARPEHAGARSVDVNALLAGLIRFRDPEWKSLGLRVQQRLSPQEVFVLGAQGQIEQVLLSLLVHAEQCAADAPGKTITIESGVLAHRAVIEVEYSVKEAAPRDPFADAPPFDTGGLGLAVCKGIIQTHGGEIRFRTRPGTARFELDLPLTLPASKEAASASVAGGARLTAMLVEPDPDVRRHLLMLLSAGGHRAVPAPPEQAADLAQRLRFDVIFWAMRSEIGRYADIEERMRPLAQALVLITDGYDAELARNLEPGGTFLLARPFQGEDVKQLLDRIASRTDTAAAARR
ncbi:MAG TPA: GAF domain-containing protein [Bryobacteraceae bacterium]|jgi:signal transduction histidine kinase/CheY-like chemotaxis protein|nr:GAF domain-containing protein [Bryobacteraceae bacterium]